MTDSSPHITEPESPEYHVLSYLVRNPGEQFSIPEIASGTDVDTGRISETVDHLVERGLVEQSGQDYSVDSAQSDSIKNRLESLDAAIMLFETAPDDAYAEEGWEDEVPSID